MSSNSIRGNNIPLNAILSTQNAGTAVGYNQATALYTSCGRYIKQVPNACTNPSGTGGSSSHTHAPSSTHTHCGNACHGHTDQTSPYTSPQTVSGGFLNCFVGTPQGHSHGVTFAPTDPGATIQNTGDHTHDAQNNDPDYIETKYIQKATTSLKLKHMPQESTVMWACTLATIPSNYSVCASIINRFPKAIPTACTTPGTTGGRSSHTHDSQGHTHTVCIPTHGTGSATIACSTGAQWGGSSPPCNWYDQHAHAAGSVAGSPASAPTAGSDCQSHTHDSQNITPPYHDVAFITQSSISIRKPGVPKNAILSWNCPLACIPAGFALADGTSCTTVNLLGKYPRGIATACTCPGATGGCATHTHSSVGHSHGNVSFAHTHTVSGTTGSAGTSSNGFPSTPSSPPIAFAPSGPYSHTHGISGSTNPGPAFVSLPTNGCHSHGALDIQPPYINLALIQKV